MKHALDLLSLAECKWRMEPKLKGVICREIAKGQLLQPTAGGIGCLTIRTLAGKRWVSVWTAATRFEAFLVTSPNSCWN